MAQAMGFEEMSGSELLDAAELLARQRRVAEVGLLRLAARWAVLHDAETLDPDEVGRPGRAVPKLYGGPGTPAVSSFAGALLGARLGVSSYAGDQLVADALDLQHRLPQLWARVEALEVQSSHARLVARRTRDLTPVQAAYVDGRVAEPADGRISWTRFEGLVEAAVKAADLDAARAREEEARLRQYARPTRSTAHGMRGFHVRTDLAAITRLDATVDYLARALAAMGSTEPLERLRTRGAG